MKQILKMYQLKPSHKKELLNRPDQRLVIKSKLKIGQPGNKYEQEADAVADRVMRMTDSNQIQMQPIEEEEELMQPKLRMQPIEEEEELLQPKLRMQPLEEEEEMLQPKIQLQEEEMLQPKFRLQLLEEEEEMIQSKAKSGKGFESSELTKHISSTKGNGQPLSTHTNQFMSKAFSTDLSGVKVHTNLKAVQMNQQLGARAFTYGNNIYFNNGEFNPNSSSGKNLLAHELTHVVQQGMTKGKISSKFSSPSLPQPTVQRYTDYSVADQIGNKSNKWKHPSGTKMMRVADSGKMAIDAILSLNIWVKPYMIKKSNDIFKANKSKIRFSEGSQSVSGKPPNNRKGRKQTLKKVVVKSDTGGVAKLTRDCGYAAQESMGSASNKLVGVTRPSGVEEYTDAFDYKSNTGEKISPQVYQKIFIREFKKTLTPQQALNAWAKLEKNKPKMARALRKKYRFNEYAKAEIGSSMTIITESKMPGYVGTPDPLNPGSTKDWNFHFATTAFNNLNDYINIENHTGSVVDWYFKMYGPSRKKQSFHDFHKGRMHGNKSTTLIVTHPGELNGKVKKSNTKFVIIPSKPIKSLIGKLSKGDKVETIRKGYYWRRVLVKSGSFVGKKGWIKNDKFERL